MNYIRKYFNNDDQAGGYSASTTEQLPVGLNLQYSSFAQAQYQNQNQYQAPTAGNDDEAYSTVQQKNTIHQSQKVLNFWNNSELDQRQFGQQNNQNQRKFAWQQIKITDNTGAKNTQQQQIQNQQPVTSNNEKKTPIFLQKFQPKKTEVQVLQSAQTIDLLDIQETQQNTPIDLLELSELFTPTQTEQKVAPSSGVQKFFKKI